VAVAVAVGMWIVEKMITRARAGDTGASARRAGKEDTVESEMVGLSKNDRL